MKKVIWGLVIAILVAILALIIVLIFNPFNSRTKLIGGIINSYLSSKIEGYVPLDKDAVVNQSTDQNPLLSADQETALTDLGVDVSQLPTEITPEMQACFEEKLGAERAAELVAGATPSAMDLLKAGSCI